MYHLKQIPSEKQIKKYIRRIIFGKNIFCPECRSRQVVKCDDRYRCKRCRAKFSLISHTWLKGMRISYQKFWLILWCWTTRVPIKQTMTLSGLSEKAIRHWFKLFRINLPPNDIILEKIVQLDEAFFKHRTLMMAKQKGTRNLAYEVLTTTNPQRHHATYFVQQHVKPRSNLRTDGAGIYQGIDQRWPVKHKMDIHKKWEFELTSEIEGTFGNYRTFVRRMYHHHWSQNLSEYVGEFCFRFSSPEIFNNPLKYLEKTLGLVTSR